MSIRYFHKAWRYVLNHWQGQNSLRWSFWVNFFLFGAVIHYLDQFVQASNFVNPDTALIAVIGYFIICRLVIYPWQIIGLLRTCDRYLLEIGGNLWARAAQGAVFLSFVLVLVSAFSTFQSLYVYLKKKPVNSDPVTTAALPKYSLELVRDDTFIHLDGEFQPGITRDLAALLEKSPDVKAMILNSDGGRIYEGRGIAKLIQQYQLDTYAVKYCKSACTIAFVAGKTRWLLNQAQLGFHQYHLESEQGHPFIDTEAEQEKDRDFFIQQKVAPDFIGKIFSTPHSEIWFPDREELLDAGMVHHFIAEITD